jgi:hypothetical protein
MIDIILGTLFVTFILGMFAAVIVMCISDTETFKAIDEKIARVIRGEDDEY